MKILILTQYFPPEVGAPQNRLFELAVRLKAAGEEVTVLTAMPNYPWMEIHRDYVGKKSMIEIMDGLTVHRTRIYVSKSKSIIQRLLNYFSFVWLSYWYGRKMKESFDYILCESPPLFLGISARLLCKVKKARLIFNVSDLWPESAEKLGLVTNKFFLWAATILEEYLYRKSFLITGQTQGIVKDISGRFPQKNVYWLPNGVDLKLFSGNFESKWRSDQGISKEAFLLVYAGILGHAQGLNLIIKAADKLRNNSRIHFLIMGSGPLREELIAEAERLELKNITFHAVVKKGEMPAILSTCDASIIPLKKLDLFKGAIPSKIFEVLAMKKPILLGVEGEAKEIFIDRGNAGIYFTPENVEELLAAILKLSQNPELCKQLGANGYAFVEEHFTRDMIANKFLDYLRELHSGAHKI